MFTSRKSQRRDRPQKRLQFYPGIQGVWFRNLTFGVAPGDVKLHVAVKLWIVVDGGELNDVGSRAGRLAHLHGGRRVHERRSIVVLVQHV